MSRSGAATALVLALCGGFPCAAASLTGAPIASLDDCDRLVRDHPEELEAYRCYWMLARRESRHNEAALRLEALLRLDPSDHRAELYLGAVEGDRGNRERAEALYAAAAEGFRAEREHLGEVYARLSLVFAFQSRGAREESAAALDLAEAAARRLEDAVPLMRVLNSRGWQAYHDRDFAAAYRAFREIESLAFPGGPLDLRSSCLSGLGAAAWAQGMLRESLEHYRAQARVLREGGDRFEEASALANCLLLADLIDAESERAAIDLAVETLDAAVASGNLRAQSMAHRLLAVYTGDDERLEHALEALRLGRLAGDRALEVSATAAWARAVGNDDPPRALELLGGAERLARESGLLDAAAGVGIERARVLWALERIDEAKRAAAAGLDRVEALRARQSDERARTSQLARFIGNYYALAWDAVRDAPSDPETLEWAFGVIERMRGRRLLETLDRARANPAPRAPAALLERRAVVFEAIAAVQKRLIDPATPAAERRLALGELERLELEEAALGQEIARADPAYARVETPSIPRLDEIVRGLDPDQALLSFQVGQGPASGEAWLLAIDRRGARVHEIPDRTGLEARVEIFLGLVARGDASARSASVVLHDELLAGALAGLPAEVTRLVLVPDGPLHRLPFDLLRDDDDAPPLIDRFRVTTAPSLTLWRRLRAGGPAAEGPALVLADPETGWDRPGRSADRAPGAGAGVPPLGRLPHARREGRAAVDRLGRGTLIRLDGAASEAFVKGEDLRRYGLLHFAAHAVVDEGNPHRSSVVLAPGDDKEDGLLQFREIVELDLSGSVVVLSACEGAAGAVDRAEGVLGLAHAFFQAGARTVVANLWRLRDDDAARLFEPFYDRIAAGDAVAEAMAAAQRERSREGAPPAAWAGMVVLGDGDVVPVPGGVAAAAPWSAAIGGFIAAVVAVLWFSLARRRAG